MFATATFDFCLTASNVNFSELLGCDFLQANNRFQLIVVHSLSLDAKVQFSGIVHSCY